MGEEFFEIATDQKYTNQIINYVFKKSRSLIRNGYYKIVNRLKQRKE
jgi:hypothetical protein